MKLEYEAAGRLWPTIGTEGNLQLTTQMAVPTSTCHPSQWWEPPAKWSSQTTPQNPLLEHYAIKVRNKRQFWLYPSPGHHFVPTCHWWVKKIPPGIEKISHCCPSVSGTEAAADRGQYPWQVTPSTFQDHPDCQPGPSCGMYIKGRMAEHLCVSKYLNPYIWMTRQET